MTGFFYLGAHYRVRTELAALAGKDGPMVVERRMFNTRVWRRMTLNELRQEAPSKSDLWNWLRMHGIYRPSPRGTSGSSIPREQRKRVSAMWTLPRELVAVVRERAELKGCSPSRFVETLLAKALIMDAAFDRARRPVDTSAVDGIVAAMSPAQIASVNASLDEGQRAAFAAIRERQRKG